LELKFGTGKAVIRSQPFRLDVFHNLDLAFSLNRRNYFQFEHLRTSRADDAVPLTIIDPDAKKPEIWDEELDGIWEPPEIANPRISGRWDEMFGTHNDTKPRGPQDIALDIAFASSKHLFGIPEHASAFSLKRTVSQNGSVLLEPYRLWNLVKWNVSLLSC
jgi:alpha 1,3-glucosidase